MKKLLFVFVAVMSVMTYSTSIYADGVVKIYKNGSYTIFHASEVDSIVFVSYSDDDEATDIGGVEALYGTWQQTNGYAIEDGEKHHEKNVGPDEAEYLKFDVNGTCTVCGGSRGIFYEYTHENKSYSFSFNQEKEELIIGDRILTIEILSSDALRLVEYDTMGAIVATYKKVENGVWGAF